MKSSHPRLFAKFLLLTALALPATVSAQDLFHVLKGQMFQQTGPTTTLPATVDPFFFEAGIDGDTVTSGFPAPPNTVAAPGGPANALPFTSDDEWFFESLFDSKADLDIAFPNGLYSLISGGGSASVNITGDRYPNVPRATLTGGFWSGTFTGGYQIAPSSPLLITTNPFTTNFLRQSGLIEIRIEQIGGGPASFDEEVSLFNPVTGAPVSLRVPAGSLQANSAYEVVLTFIRFTGMTTFNNNPNYDVIGAYLTQTSFEIFTSGPGGVPPILTTPTNSTVLAPATATFKVTATGTGPFTYQWQFFDPGLMTFFDLPEGGHYAGTKTATLTVKNTNQFMTGLVVRCVVTGPGGTTNGNVAQLIVNAKPTILTQPMNQSVVQGGTANFVVVANGTAPVNFQWKKNGVNIPGETTNILEIDGIVGGDAGTYTCVISNTFGTVTSAPVKLVVATVPVITEQPRVLIALLLPAVASINVKATGTAPLAYQWQFSKNNGATFANLTNGNGVTGATSASLKLTKAFFEKEGIALDFPCIFQCVVTNGVGSVTSNQSTVIPGSKPVITTQPLSQTGIAGGTVTLSAGATGSAPLNFQWKRNGQNLTGETGATLMLDDFGASDAGTYTCVVTNGYGTATSKPAILKVGFPPSITQQPVDKSVVAPTAATFTVKAGGTAPFTYQWQISVMGGNFTNLSNGGHFSGVTTATLKVSNTELPMSGLRFQCIVNNGTNLPATSNPATLNVGAKPTITTQPTGGSAVAGGNFTFTVVAGGTGPLNYQWKKNGVNIPDSNSPTLVLNPVGSASAATYTCVVSNLFGMVTSKPVKLAVALPPGGIYFGTYSGGGTSGNIAMLVSGSTVQILSFSPSGRTAAISLNVSVNSSGAFSTTLQPGNVQINGTCTSTGFSGTFTGGGGSGAFTGTKKLSTGYLQSSAGFFAGLTASSSGFNVINPAGPSGNSFAIIAADGTMVFACIGTDASAGTAFGGTGKVAANFAVTGSTLPPGQTTFSVVGSMGSGGAVGVNPFVTGAFNQGLFNPRGALNFVRTVPLIP